jgi:hypothetical protein
MSAPPLPATSGLAASKSATGSSTPLRLRRRRRCGRSPACSATCDYCRSLLRRDCGAMRS